MTSIEITPPKLNSDRIIACLIAFSPLFTGLFVAFFLYRSYDDNASAFNIFNIHNWGIMRYSTVEEYVLLYIMMISNVIIILLGTIVYIADVWDGLTGVIRGREGMEFLLCALFAAGGGVICCLAWFALYFSTNLLSAIGVDTQNLVNYLVAWNDGFVILVFIFFLIGDICLFKSYSQGSRHCHRDGVSEDAQECEARKRFAKDAIQFVDGPVLIGSVLLLIFSTLGLTDPRFAAEGPQIAQYATYSGAHMTSATPVGAFLPSVFVGGFSLGSISCQLAYSQIVFAVLILRHRGSSLTRRKRSSARVSASKGGGPA